MFVYDKEKKDLNLSGTAFGQTKDADRRYLPRWQVDNKILYQAEEGAALGECRSRDINSSGACIRMPDDVPLQQRLNLTIFLAKDIDPIQVRGAVVWKAPHDGENWFGIKFDRVSEKTNDLIFNYAFEYKKDEVMKRWFKDC